MSVHLLGPFRKVVLRLCEDVNTPRSLLVSLLIKYEQWDQLFTLRCEPLHYTDAETFAADNLVTELLRKLDLDGVSDKARLERECFERLLATERTCFITNQRLRRFRDGLLDQPGDARILKFLQDAKSVIRSLVGPLPADLRECGFGPGATLTNKSALSTVPDKIESTPCGTRSAVYLFDLLFRESAWDRAQRPHQRARAYARGNRFFTVPKSALSLRGAALSPNVNGFLQKGVGKYLRGRLARVGIHIGGQPCVNGFSINDWTSADVHRAIARESSRSGDYATIDLSDASNTIAKELIRLLWPSQWFDLLSDLREPLMEGPDGRMRYLEMFSAMGNGFTFEVETITFYAIALAAGADRAYVFGDDIIVPTQSSSDVLGALRWCGFTPNPRKTYTIGPFRESCGGDYFNGVNVRSHYVEKVPSAPEQWIALANGLRRFCRSGPSPTQRWTYVRRAWWAALDPIPGHLRGLRGPEGLGDLVIHDDDWPAREKDGIRYVRGYAPVVSPVPLDHWPSRVVYASALYGVPSDGPVPRSAVSGYRVKWVPYS